ncbi:hypothetical protein AK812_SmicGene29899 [Symbiodinium microadriaticum]|uniref:Uncharacterized protein n=1 Tax=Symbiodinium microadriaticum TaxID=2951 RepID=A0A1Q9BUQ9_SYMMI|nr:hypothetical protein AK812_SmicGene46015 [Symbiodinium microadriaticum]OLP88725.1 hypothetical protein AK812_SmicGene29899 [Symbiodinium microadriaticum]
MKSSADAPMSHPNTVDSTRFSDNLLFFMTLKAWPDHEAHSQSGCRKLAAGMISSYPWSEYDSPKKNLPAAPMDWKSHLHRGVTQSFHFNCNQQSIVHGRSWNRMSKAALRTASRPDCFQKLSAFIALAWLRSPE